MGILRDRMIEEMKQTPVSLEPQTKRDDSRTPSTGR
jgi:hypothetical protein